MSRMKDHYIGVLNEKNNRKPWTYKGFTVWPAARNSSGIRWYAMFIPGIGTVRADTKQGIRQLINEYVG